MFGLKDVFGWSTRNRASISSLGYRMPSRSGPPAVTRKVLILLFVTFGDEPLKDLAGS